MDETLCDNRVLTLLHADTSATELFDPALLPLGGSTVLEQVIKRVQSARFGHNLVVVTSGNRPALSQICALQGVPLEVIPAHAPWQRIEEIAHERGAETLVRCHAHQVFLSPRMLDACALYALESGMDYVTVTRLPQGVSAEAFPIHSFHTLAPLADALPKPLEKTALEAQGDLDTAFLPAPLFMRRPDVRLTLETARDHTIFQQIFESVPVDQHGFHALEEIFAYLDSRPKALQTLRLSDPLRYAA